MHVIPWVNGLAGCGMLRAFGVQVQVPVRARCTWLRAVLGRLPRAQPD